MAGAVPADRDLMQHALSLAARGWGRVQPNPMVGALVVRDGAVIAEGWHTEYGGPHGEVVALEAAGARARGATLYVTLEPCSHHGKTPPCVDAITNAGIARVVIAAEDPNPQAAGGATRLRSAGIHVETGVARDEARGLNAAFFHWHEHGTPYVALKYALSLDGMLSAAPGVATAITGAAALDEVHRLRAGFDAIVVGHGTVAADDPQLSVRGAVVPRVPPVRVVLDSRLATPLAARLIAGHAEAPVWIIAADDAPPSRERALVAAGARVLRVAPGPGGVDVDAAVTRLGTEGIRSVLCEGGGQVGTALLEAGVVRRLYLFYAPDVLGPGGTPGFPRRTALPAWRPLRVERLGRDVLIVLEPA